MNLRQSAVRIASTLILLGSVASPRLGALAADAEVPPEVQAALTLRILEYDRGLTGWAGGSLRVGVISRGGAADYRRGLDGQKAQGLGLATSQLRPGDESAIRAWIQSEGVGLLYVSSDAGDRASAAIAAAKALDVPTLASTRGHFEAGATLGIVVRDAKPHILVRLPGAKAAGMDLDPKLLRLAEVVQ
jgi:hypothetical protein